ncbi:M23 family metallopeptidase [Bacteroidota bacterium]
MKNFYYFSKSKLKFVEIRNFYRKFVFLILFFSIIFSFVLFSAYYVINEFVNPNAEVEALQSTNSQLQTKLSDLLDKYSDINEALDSMSVVNNSLRLAVNLEPLTNADREFGIGGKIFDDIDPTNSQELNNLVTKLNSVVEEVSIKLDIERNNYNEIGHTLELNKKLYDGLPAIKPVAGYYGNKFGMRLHPILKIRRMHTGQDIVCGTGTKVYASGGGKVDFAGRRGSLGITVEIDHGFGYRTVYGHLSKLLCRKGQKVKRGDLIALSGNTGRLSLGPHLHYEVRHEGIAKNPRDFIYDDVELFEIISHE